MQIYNYALCCCTDTSNWMRVHWHDTDTCDYIKFMSSSQNFIHVVVSVLCPVSVLHKLHRYKYEYMMFKIVKKKKKKTEWAKLRLSQKQSLKYPIDGNQAVFI